MLIELENIRKARLLIPATDTEAINESYKTEMHKSLELIKYTQKVIAPAELMELPRGVIDEALKPCFDSTVDDLVEYAFEDPDPPENYHCFDYGTRETGPHLIDMLDYVGESSNQPSNDFTLTSYRNRNGGNLIINHYAPMSIDAAKEDKRYVDTLFKKYVEKSEKNKTEAKEMLARRKKRE